MNLDEILAQVANARPGYALASFKEAALPVFLLTARVLILEKKQLNPIEEGCLRAVDVGLSTPEDLSAFLGLHFSMLTPVMAALNAGEFINYSRVRVPPPRQSPSRRREGWRSRKRSWWSHKSSR